MQDCGRRYISQHFGCILCGDIDVFLVIVLAQQAVHIRWCVTCMISLTNSKRFITHQAAA